MSEPFFDWTSIIKMLEAIPSRSSMWKTADTRKFLADVAQMAAAKRKSNLRLLDEFACELQNLQKNPELGYFKAFREYRWDALNIRQDDLGTAVALLRSFEGELSEHCRVRAEFGKHSDLRDEEIWGALLLHKARLQETFQQIRDLQGLAEGGLAASSETLEALRSEWAEEEETVAVHQPPPTAARGGLLAVSPRGQSKTTQEAPAEIPPEIPRGTEQEDLTREKPRDADESESAWQEEHSLEQPERATPTEAFPEEHLNFPPDAPGAVASSEPGRSRSEPPAIQSEVAKENLTADEPQAPQEAGPVFQEEQRAEELKRETSEIVFTASTKMKKEGTLLPDIELLEAGFNEAQLNARIWELIACGDLGAAYWVAEAMGKLALNPEVPPAVVTLLQYARGIDRDHPLANELEQLAYKIQPQPYDHLTVAASAVRAAALLWPVILLVLPDPKKWLMLSSGSHLLAEVASLAEEMQAYNVHLRCLEIASIHAASHATEEAHAAHEVFIQYRKEKSKAYINGPTLCAAARQLDNWLPKVVENALEGKIEANDFGGVLKRVSSSDPLRAIVTQTVDDNSVLALSAEQFLETSIKKLEPWAKGQHAFERLREILMKEAQAVVEGGGNSWRAPRRHGQDEVTEVIHGAIKKAFAWLKACQKSFDARHHLSAGWRTTKDYICKLAEAAERSTNSAETVAFLHQEGAGSVARRVLESALADLAATLRSGDIPLVRTDSLRTANLGRLLSVGGLEVDFLGLPLERDSNWHVILNTLGSHSYQEQPLKHAFQDALAASEWERVHRMLQWAPQSDRVRMEGEWQCTLRSLQPSFEAKLKELRDKAFHDLYQGALPDVTFQILTSDLSRNLPSDPLGVRDLTEILKVAALELAEARSAAATARHRSWTQVQEDLRRTGCHETHLLSTLDAMIRRLLDGTEFRTVDETLDQFRMLLHQGPGVTERLEAWLATHEQEKKDILREFINGHEARYNRLASDREYLAKVADTFVSGGCPPGFQSTSDHAVLVGALKCWLKLKRDGPQRPDNAGALWHLLQFFGFRSTVPAENPVKAVPNGARKSEPFKYELFSAHITMGEDSPVPQLGRLSGAPVEVLVCWSALRPEETRSRLRELGLLTSPETILFLLNPISFAHRDAFGRHFLPAEDGGVTSPAGLAVFLLDEVLFLTLLGCEAPRREAFLELTMPFTGINPYKTEVHDEVDPQMFVGRKDLIEALLTAKKNLVIFGGRQLGKTATLKQLARLHHNPIRNQIVVHIVVQQAFGSIWAMIDERLRNCGFFKDRNAVKEFDHLEGRIDRAFQQQPQMRVLLLLDDMEYFLKNEAGSGNVNLLNLVKLMQTRSNLRVILAGNCHTQRFIQHDSISENFGRPVVVGPLSIPESIQLITRPMRALGYRFTSRTEGGVSPVIQEILSYTFGYAGMLQLFMNKLLNMLARRGRNAPRAWPYEVETKDVAEVLRPEVSTLRMDLQNRFHLTAASDDEYGIILCCLILDQRHKNLERSEFCTANGILEAMRPHYPLPSSSDALRWLKPRLLEMVGLGLLIGKPHSEPTEFSIRSLRLLELYGKSEVHHLLAQCIENKPTPTSGGELESRHAPPVDGKHLYYSPFAADDRMILRDGPKVRILIGSEATGMRLFPDALARIYVEDRDQSVTTPSVFLFADLESGMRPEQDEARAVICYHDFVEPGQVRGMPASMKRALNLLNKPNLARRDVSLSYLLRPPAAWEWHNFQRTNLRPSALDKIQVFSLRRWDIYAVRGRLMDKFASAALKHAEALLVATGGWPFLLDEFFERTKRPLDVPRLCEEFGNELATPGSDLGLKFLGALEIETRSVPGRALRFLLNNTLSRTGYSWWHEFWSTSEMKAVDFSSEEECAATLSFLQDMQCVVQHEEDGALVIQVEPVLARVLTANMG